MKVLKHYGRVHYRPQIVWEASDFQTLDKWYSPAADMLDRLMDLMPDWEAWYDMAIDEGDDYQTIHDKIAAKIVELENVAVINITARNRDLFNENHPRPETGF